MGSTKIPHLQQTIYFRDPHKIQHTLIVWNLKKSWFYVCTCKIRIGLTKISHLQKNIRLSFPKKKNRRSDRNTLQEIAKRSLFYICMCAICTGLIKIAHFNKKAHSHVSKNANFNIHSLLGFKKHHGFICARAKFAWGYIPH